MGAGLDASASKPKVIQPLSTFKDMVCRMSWKCATMSGDGETIAASIDCFDQTISLWSASNGMSKCKLKDAKGSLDVVVGMEWHPRRGAMATLGPSGGIYL